MSYAIIRNANYKMNQIPMIERHIERLNHNYSNNDIDFSRSSENYHIKKINADSYLKEFERIKDENSLKGNLRLTGKKQSNVMCEFIITSDKEFFEKLGEDGTRRFFDDAYDFVKKKVGEEYIASFCVHMDEKVPHAHCLFLPVIDGKDRKGNPCKRINCSEFWKGRDSYSRLQDEYHTFITSRGYDLKRGEKGSTTEHLSVAEYKLKKTEENLNKTAEKADEIKNNIANENEKSVLLRRKARNEYAIATKAKEEAEKVKEELEKAKDDIALEKRVIELNKSMLSQILKIYTDEKEQLTKEMAKIRLDYSQFFEMKKRFIDFAKTQIKSMCEDNKRKHTNQINANMFVYEATENMNDYVTQISQKYKNKDKNLSL